MWSRYTRHGVQRPHVISEQRPLSSRYACDSLAAGRPPLGPYFSPSAALQFGGMTTFGPAAEYHLVPLERLPPARNIFNYGAKDLWHSIAEGSTRERLADRFRGADKRRERELARRYRADTVAGALINDHDEPERSHVGADFVEAIQRAHELTLTFQPWEESAVRVAINPTGKEPLDPQTRLTMSLIMNPITWSPGNDLVNGQHRVAGARAVGVPEILVRMR